MTSFNCQLTKKQLPELENQEVTVHIVNYTCADTGDRSLC